MPLNDDFKSQVLAATDIVDLIGQSVSLKRRGKDFVGLCPFHQEKTPSFHVSPTKQYFICFGCKASGSVFDFIMKRDHLEFLDALKFLAERRAGIEMPKYGVSKQKTGERQLLFDAHSAACSVYEKLLATEMGTPARQYLQQRGFTPEFIQKFQVGFAPESWDTLLRSELLKKFPPTLLATAGLAKSRQTGTGFYDTFRNRIIFPIRDVENRVIAFGGRQMPGGEEPKYLNSPETPLFSKSRTVFGLDLGRQKIVDTRTVAIVEGYTDVMMAHQFGCSNVVATLGTAMTEQHINLLKRFADRIVLLFDADVAGDTAVDRAVSLFLAHPIDIQIASIPEDLDPDEFLIKHGPDAFNKLLANATDALSYKWKQLLARFRQSPNDLTGQQKAVDEYLSLLAAARSTGPIDALRWGAILARVSKLTDIPAEQLNNRFSPKSPKNRQRHFSATVSPASSPAPLASAPINALDRAERQILGLILLHPDHWNFAQQNISAEDFTAEPRRRLADLCWNHHRNEGAPVLSEFLTELNQANLAELALDLVEESKTILEEDVANALGQAIEYIRRAGRERAGRTAAANLRDPNSADDEVAVLRQLAELASQRKKNV